MPGFSWYITPKLVGIVVRNTIRDYEPLLRVRIETILTIHDAIDESHVDAK
jgi:hypothetical protein